MKESQATWLAEIELWASRGTPVGTSACEHLLAIAKAAREVREAQKVYFHSHASSALWHAGFERELDILLREPQP